MATSNGERRTRLDVAIDATVRGMMHRDAPPGFGGRLAGRLDGARPGSLWLIPALASAAVAVIAVTVFVLASMRLSDPAAPSTTPAPVVASEAERPAPLQAAAATKPQHTAERTSPAQAPTAAPRRHPRTSESIFGPRTTTVTAASLAAVEPPEDADAEPEQTALPPGHPALAVPPLAPVPDIVVAPIQIDRIMIPSRSGSR